MNEEGGLGEPTHRSPYRPCRDKPSRGLHTTTTHRLNVAERCQPASTDGTRRHEPPLRLEPALPDLPDPPSRSVTTTRPTNSGPSHDAQLPTNTDLTKEDRAAASVNGAMSLHRHHARNTTRAEEETPTDHMRTPGNGAGLWRPPRVDDLR